MKNLRILFLGGAPPLALQTLRLYRGFSIAREKKKMKVRRHHSADLNSLLRLKSIASRL